MKTRCAIFLGLLFAAMSQCSFRMPLSCQYNKVSQVYVHNTYDDCQPHTSDDYFKQHSIINCSSIESALKATERYSGVVIHLVSDQVRISKTITVYNRSNVCFIGNNHTRITCDKKTGFNFIETENITLSFLEISECGARHVYITNTKKRIYFQVALFFNESKNIAIDRINVTDSQGIGLAMFNSRGNVTVVYSIFASNTHANSTGGGVHFTINRNSIYNETTNVNFENCHFINNTKRSNKYFAGLESGGGIQIRLNGKTTHVHIQLIKCKIIGNRAEWGGGLFIGILKAVLYCRISVLDCDIIGNKALGNHGGGGFDMGFYSYSSHVDKKSKYIDLRFTNCTIDSNSAIQGGGSNIFSSYRKKSEYNNTLIFYNCTWSNNTANYSSAISVSPNKYEKTCIGFAVEPNFTNCRFINNRIVPETLEGISEAVRVKAYKTSSLSTFTVVAGFSVYFEGYTQFVNNTGTALNVYFSEAWFMKGSEILFSNNKGTKGGAVSVIGISVFRICSDSKAVFENNTAKIGGAIAFNGKGKLVVFKNTTISFKKNSAQFGGAIHYQLDQTELLSSKDCFLADTRNSSLIFEGNQAFTKYGHSMYASTLYPCIKYCKNKCRCSHYCNDLKCNSTEIIELLNCCFGNFTISSKRQSIITGSDAYMNSNNDTVGNHRRAKPGEIISFATDVRDELGHDVTSITVYKVSVDGPNDSNFQIDSSFEFSANGKVKIYGVPNTSRTITFTTTDVKALTIHYNVTLVDCPPGYDLSDDPKAGQTHCKCMENKYMNLYCEKKSIKSYIRDGTWVGYANHGHNLTTAICPLGFCNDLEKYQTKDPSIRKLPDLHICVEGRSGILCGECVKNHSVAYHSVLFECQKDTYNCNYGILLYLVAEIIPVTILFLVVLLGNINFTSGPINGFILFAQIVDLMYINGSNPKLLTSNPYVINFHTFVYGILNLYFDTVGSSLSFCLWKGATTLHVIAMKYVTIVYSLILVMCLVKFLSHCTCHRICKFCRKQSFGNSIIYGLSAFLVMCYSQCTRVTFQILQPTILFKEGPSVYKLVVHLNGELDYFSSSGHLQYAIPAIFFFMTVVALPPIVLTFNSLMTVALHYLDKKGLLNLSTKWNNRLLMVKFKPLLDVFQGCYRDQWRCFAGFYFMYKVFFLSLFFFIPTKALCYTTSLFLLIGIISLHSIVQPYKKRLHNTLDIFMLTNAAIITCISIYTNERSSDRFNILLRAQQLQLLLVYTPMACVIMYIMYSFIRKFPILRFKFYQRQRMDSSFPARMLSNSAPTDYMSCSD